VEDNNISINLFLFLIIIIISIIGTIALITLIGEIPVMEEICKDKLGNDYYTWRRSLNGDLFCVNISSTIQQKNQISTHIFIDGGKQ
jgi:hypothetical protein